MLLIYCCSFTGSRLSRVGSWGCLCEPERVRSMLRCASTWHHFCLAHPLRHQLPDLQSLTIFRSFSTSFEDESRPDSPRVVSSSQPSSDTARKPQEQKVTFGDKTTTIHSSRQSNGIRNRPRTLRPLLIQPTFPQSIIPETLSSDSQHSSRTQKDTSEIDFSVTITLANLPPSTLKSDIRPVFQQFGEIQRVIVGPDGTRADIIFTDVQGVKRTLHAYAEEPFFVRGQEIVMFRKCAAPGFKAANDHNDHQATATTKASRGRARQDWGDGSGVIFVSQFPSGTTQDELSEAFSRFGRYERFVMRMYKYLYHFFLLCLLSGLCTQDPAQDTHMLCIRATIVLSKYYVLISAYQSMSKGKTYVSSALRIGHTPRHLARQTSH